MFPVMLGKPKPKSRSLLDRLCDIDPTIDHGLKFRVDKICTDFFRDAIEAYRITCRSPFKVIAPDIENGGHELRIDIELPDIDGKEGE